MASSSEGGVDGVTAGVLEALLPTVGLPVVKGKLNERTVARCAELVLVGTGMGACHVSSLDGVALGSSTALSSACQRLLSQHFTEEGTWSSLGRTMSERVWPSLTVCKPTSCSAMKRFDLVHRTR